MNILRKPQNEANYIAIIAIGEQFLKDWQDYMMPSLISYCDNNDLGLVVFEQDMIEKSHPKWKKAHWQKLLIGTILVENNVEVNNVCFLDADILVNPFAPNVFDCHDDDKISVVSETKLVFPHQRMLRKIAFFRNRYLSKDYPLDSSLFMSLEQLYQYHDMPVQPDKFCSGFFIFNIENFSKLMEEWFYKYDKDVRSITNDGDEMHLNYEFQNHGKIKWLDYKFQALWVYEMSEKYPFLYQQFDNQDLVNQCIRASLQQNYFLHFAGRWEGNVWHNTNIMNEEFLTELADFNNYLNTPVTGRSAGGTIGPKSKI